LTEYCQARSNTYTHYFPYNPPQRPDWLYAGGTTTALGQSL
jgi:hypothetical protein